MKTLSKISILVSAVLLIFLGGCKKNGKAQQIDMNAIQLDIHEATEEELLEQAIQYWHITEQKVCVLMGYDFNTPESIEKYTAIFSERYGLAEDGGLIMMLTYPDSFKHGGKAYSSDFASVLNDTANDFCGLILLGAPEKTHLALAKMQDFWEMKVPYPVFALFPQDDVLGLESTCDFVLDKAQEADLTGSVVNEEIENNIGEEASDIILKSIDYMLAQKSPFAKDITLSKHIEQMLKGQKISHYSDPETGIQSINHFVLN